MNSSKERSKGKYVLSANSSEKDSVSVGVPDEGGRDRSSGLSG